MPAGDSPRPCPSRCACCWPVRCRRHRPLTHGRQIGVAVFLLPSRLLSARSILKHDALRENRRGFVRMLAGRVESVDRSCHAWSLTESPTCLVVAPNVWPLLRAIDPAKCYRISWQQSRTIIDHAGRGDALLCVRSVAKGSGQPAGIVMLPGLGFLAWRVSSLRVAHIELPGSANSQIRIDLLFKPVRHPT